MPLPSIGARLCLLVALMCLLLLLAVSMLFLKKVDSHLHERTMEVLRLDKALSSLEAREESALRSDAGDTGQWHFHRDDLSLAGLGQEVEDLLAKREEIFDQLLALTRRIEKEHTDVFSQLLEITKGVRYIHRHHVAYLQNLVNRDALSSHVSVQEKPWRNPNESASTELSIVQESLNIYTSLFDIHAGFIKLHQAGPDGLEDFFTTHMSRFNAAINNFEDYSIDAQDGLLIEELLLVGKKFEQSFFGLMEMERERVRLSGLLGESKTALNAATQQHLARQEAEIRKTQCWSDILQFAFIVSILLLGFLLLVCCSQLSRAVRQIVAEARRLQDDLGHRVDEKSAKFGEFQLVFNTFNKMARALGKQMRQLTDLAFHDTLTGLPNRALLLNRLQQAIRANQQDPGRIFALVFLDLDRFKIVNDSLGHKCGDELLKAFGRTLAESVREGDTVARLGGDEFAILLENLPSRRNVIRMVKSIRNRISQLIPVAERAFAVQASIGIAITPKGKKPEDVLRDADIAMYTAKKKGAGRFKVYTPRLGRQALSVLNMELDLRQAIEKREIEVHYQPIIELETRRTHGFEALARWHHPTHGPIDPSQFITLAEETGLILPLGRLVLGQACRQVSRWNRSLPPEDALTLHVNLSPRQLRDAGLVQEVARVLDECRMEARLLTLEITETMLMDDDLGAMNTLNRLKDLGVGLSLDDFGTGYSSLGNLHDYPVDTFKIDRSFVGRVDSDGKTEHMIQMVLALSRALEKEVVAEGVETVEQAELLRSLKCRYVQGFYYSRPLGVQEAGLFIEAERLSGRKASRLHSPRRAAVTPLRPRPQESRAGEAR